MNVNAPTQNNDVEAPKKPLPVGNRYSEAKVIENRPIRKGRCGEFGDDSTPLRNRRLNGALWKDYITNGKKNAKISHEGDR